MKKPLIVRRLNTALIILVLLLSSLFAYSSNVGFINSQVTATGNVVGVTQHLIFNVFGPNAIQAADNEVLVWPVTDDALTVTSVTVQLDAAGNDVTGDVKWADAFIGLANATVINVFDTTSGVLVDTTITAGAVAAGKCIYISFDAAPNAAITQMVIDVEYDYD